MNVESVPISELHQDPANARRHPERNLDAIKASLARFGQQKPVVVDAKGIVRAGNGTLSAAKALGWDTLAVVRTPLAGSEATAYAISDNRSAELATWDDDALASTLKALSDEDFDMEVLGFDEDELAGMLDGLGGNGESTPDPGAQTDRAAELQAQWKTESGQLWVIPSKATPGREHWLLCGDSTKAEDVARLCPEKVQGAFTSPPYAELRKEQYGGTPSDQYVAWWESIQANIRSVLKEDGSFFVNIKAHCEDGERSLYVMDLVLAMKRQWRWKYIDELCWIRHGFPGTYGPRFKNSFEPIHHFALESPKFRVDNVLIESSTDAKTRERDAVRSDESKGGAGRNHGVSYGEMARPSNILKLEGVDGVLHAAAFPVGLPDFFLRAFSDSTDVWLDPFSGSGTTLVAAEQTGRLCYGIEIAPAYVAVALERLAGLGLEPRLT